MSLKAQIDAYNVQKDAKLPADVLALMNTTHEELIAQHIKDNALQIGQE
ncbi:AhpC/TSA family protein, partial [Pseudoalteromonas issachenkonii]